MLLLLLRGGAASGERGREPSREQGAVKMSLPPAFEEGMGGVGRCGMDGLVIRIGWSMWLDCVRTLEELEVRTAAQQPAEAPFLLALPLSVHVVFKNEK